LSDAAKILAAGESQLLFQKVGKPHFAGRSFGILQIRQSSQKSIAKT
jgi:hypothetical protein